VLRQRVERIVDVGANVGYTTLYWSRLFPGARFKAFEPHPLILPTLKANLALNRLSERVLVFPAAAGTKNSVVKLTDAGVGSTVTQMPTGRSFEVPMVDFFEALANEPIDLLKLDCEGAEYDLVSDPRFADLRAKAMVFEWHATAERPHAKREIFKMLTLYKWRVEPISEYGLSQPEFGLLNTGVAWAFNQN
jgi:FkbM family methyltransferase